MSALEVQTGWGMRWEPDTCHLFAILDPALEFRFCLYLHQTEDLSVVSLRSQPRSLTIPTNLNQSHRLWHQIVSCQDLAFSL